MWMENREGSRERKRRDQVWLSALSLPRVSGGNQVSLSPPPLYVTRCCKNAAGVATSVWRKGAGPMLQRAMQVQSSGNFLGMTFPLKTGGYLNDTFCPRVTYVTPSVSLNSDPGVGRE